MPSALALVAAVDRRLVIGRDGAMPWHLPDDLRHFKSLTLGAPILMGRKTFESIGHSLPGRRNLVLTRSTGYTARGIECVASLDEAIRAAAGAPRLFVIGGGEIYAQALPLAATLHLTEIDAEFAGDTRFPEFDRTHWREVQRERHVQPAPPHLRYAFVTYERPIVR